MHRTFPSPDRILTGHVDMESAYNVDDYPYSWKLRCQIRYWLEDKPKHGTRMVSQTLNPKTGVWNKPKPGTYSDIEIMFLDDEDHVRGAAVRTWDNLEVLEAFAVATEGKLTDDQAKRLTAMLIFRRAYDARKAEAGATV